MRDVPEIFAHRGASVTARENTVEAFRAAVAAGADGVELDVRRSADGDLVVHHDPRLGDGSLIIETPTTALPEHVPGLGAALDACGQLTVNIEIKNAPTDPDFDPARTVADEIVAVIGARGLTDHVIVTSFDLATVDRIGALDPAIRTGWLVAGGGLLPLRYRRTLRRCVDHGHGAINPWYGAAGRRFVDLAHELGLAVNVWTVDDPSDMASLAARGVDTIITNVPDVAVATLR